MGRLVWNYLLGMSTTTSEQLHRVFHGRRLLGYQEGFQDMASTAGLWSEIAFPQGISWCPGAYTPIIYVSSATRNLNLALTYTGIAGFRLICGSRCGIQPHRSWEDSLQQMVSLTTPCAPRLLTVWAWQATIYWLWNEMNTMMHANTFRSVDALFRVIDRQLLNKILSFRELNPTLSSAMIQLWLA